MITNFLSDSDIVACSASNKLFSTPDFANCDNLHTKFCSIRYATRHYGTIQRVLKSGQVARLVSITASEPKQVMPWLHVK